MVLKCVTLVKGMGNCLLIYTSAGQSSPHKLPCMIELGLNSFFNRIKLKSET